MKKSAMLRIGNWAQYTFRCASIAPVVEFDSKVSELIENSQLHPKQHPGTMRNVNIQLPEDIQNAMTRTIGDTSRKMLMNEAYEFSKFLHARKPPMEQDEEFELVSSIRKEVKEDLNLDWENISDETRNHYQKTIDSKVEQLTKQRKYNWSQIEFTRHMGLVYMVSRSAREYAINFQVLKELKNRFQYTPRTVFDFGSGVGSVMWAADDLWSESLKEVFTIDASAHMNDISREMLVNADRKHLKKVVFQRQFLPMSSAPSYDVVVSSFSLLELSSVQSRLETVLNLWTKTNDFLVLVESGTKAGFHVINEAKDFLLWRMGKRGAERSQKGHVVSPCPHNLTCPMRSSGDPRPCNFSATYTSYPQTTRNMKELYSYVILRKGRRPPDDPDWPRIVRPVLTRHKHCICRMCTPHGKLAEVIFTPNKHGKTTYKCARQSKWGDRFPITVEDIPEDSKALNEDADGKCSDTDESVVMESSDNQCSDGYKIIQ